MKVSRAPERRGGANKLVLLVTLVGVAIVVGVLVTYFTTGFESRAATGDQSGPPVAASNPGPGETQQEHASAASADATPMPTAAPRMLEVDPDPLPGFIPDVYFGEALAQGFVELKLPGNSPAQSWYTFQVNTVSRDITLFFAVYDSSLNHIVRTVKIEGYSQGRDLDSAQVTLFYPDGPERVMVFDRAQGTMTVTQQIRPPHGPSLFSPDLRVSLVNQRMKLSDESGAVNAELQMDLTGLSDSEFIVFQRTSPAVVAEVLAELKELVQQVEVKRPR